MTASGMLAQIKKDFFKGVNLSAASKLEGDARRTFRLLQVERLLTDKMGNDPLAMWLSDMFWTADEGRQLMMPPHPLLSPQEQQGLTDREMGHLRLILEIAGLCHDLSLHYSFDLKKAFGVKDHLWVMNKQLVEWLTTTEYEQIAMHTTYILKKHAINVYAFGHYLPAQDELADLYSLKYRQLVGIPYSTTIPPREYVKILLDEMLRIERHWWRGRKLKLRPDLVMLHDELFGAIPYQFNKRVLKAAQELYDYMDTQLYGQLTKNEHNYMGTSWDDLPKSVKRKTAEILERFANKIREVRDQYLPQGWLADDSLAFSYLMEHGHRCGYGWWREEDEAL